VVLCFVVSSIFICLFVSANLQAEDGDIDDNNNAYHENQCVAGGMGKNCIVSEDCANNSMATICIETEENTTCQIPCGGHKDCSIGETCVKGTVPGENSHGYCRPSAFRMDLNLLDSCITHFIDGLHPDVSSTGSYCSIERNLTRMLDQNSDNVFDIFDVDKCIRTFIDEEEDCISEDECSPDKVYCEDNLDCGEGLYCKFNGMSDIDGNGYIPRDCIERYNDEIASIDVDGDTEVEVDYKEILGTCYKYLTYLEDDQKSGYCERECGFIANREINSIDKLDRECSGALKACNRLEGKCVKVNIDGTTCQVDRECPNGSYCYLGTCAENCYRGVDCPDSNWYCENNKCKPKPRIGMDEGAFEPKNYSLSLAYKDIYLNEIDSEVEIPLVIMNRQTRKQEFSNSALVFGYRITLTNYANHAEKCFEEDSDSDSDCVFLPEEEFITALNPFGTIYGVGKSSIDLRIDPILAKALAPGKYSAKLRVVFSNGTDASAVINYTKMPLSGGYSGKINLYVDFDDSDSIYGTSSVDLELLMEENDANNEPLYDENGYADDEKLLEWEELETLNKIVDDDGLGNLIEDNNKGMPVYGFINGNTSLIFNNSDAITRGENKIPVKGIYSPESGKLRLIAVLDLEQEFCRNEDGECNNTDACKDFLLKEEYDTDEDNITTICNMFNRRVRRVVQFYGPFDSLTRRYHGIYRETITGMVPKQVTIDGDFSMVQVSTKLPTVADEIKKNPLVDDYSNLTYNVEDVKDNLEDYLLDSCPAYFSEQEEEDVDPCSKELVGNDSFGDPKLKSSDSYLNYLECLKEKEWVMKTVVEDDVEVQKLTNTYPRLFRQLVTFESEIAGALESIDGSNTSAELTMNEFLSGQITYCTDNTCDDTCIDQNKVKCGLALYQYALLSEWVNRDELALTLGADPGWLEECDPDDTDCDNGGGNDYISGYSVFPLFVEKDYDRAPLGGDPKIEAQPARFTYQEYARFYKENTQALKFEAGNALSDAMMQLYKKASGDEIDSYAAFNYKEDALMLSYRAYTELLKNAVSPESTMVLFDWQMLFYKNIGNPIISQLESIMQDRMDTLAGLVDLKRRKFMNNDSKDFIFINHVLQQEYLLSRYIVELQKHWQKERFKYSGSGSDLMKYGQQLVNRINENRNPLGIFPDEIYFENSNLNLSNWENYQNTLNEKLPVIEQDIETAITQTKALWQDQDNLINNLQAQRHVFEEKIASICGSPDEISSVPEECMLDSDELQVEQECLDTVDENCIFEFVCEENDEECNELASKFKSETEGFECRIDDFKPTIEDIDESEEKYDRICNRGIIGTLMQEKVLLELSQKQVYTKLNSYLNQLKNHIQILQNTYANDEKLLTTLGVLHAAITYADVALLAIGYTERVGAIAAANANCGPTSCPQATGGASTYATLAANLALIEAGIKEGKIQAEFGITMAELQYRMDSNVMSQKMTIEDLSTHVTNYIAEYNMLTQQIFNTKVRIRDQLFMAELAVKHKNENLTTVIDHLLNKQTGNALTRNEYVQKVDSEFYELLILTYKMARAFVHSYNLKNIEEEINSRVFRIMTPTDIYDFITFLKDMERDYCGSMQFADCDYVNNDNYFKYSMRNQLFPELNDIVDTKTGKVLTKGQQFHNIITSTEYIKKRVRGFELIDQIEIPFAIWLNDRGELAYQRWMLPITECNHIIIGDSQEGTFAVNVIGTNLETIQYELWRGNTDYIRSCNVESVIEEVGMDPVAQYPINSFIVGYAPHNSLTNSEEVPTFLSTSGSQFSCLNRVENDMGYINDSSCYNYFARDRSLAAPDYVLTIPLGNSSGSGVGYGNEWIVNEDRESQPIIEDIILYFKYRKLPSNE